MEPRHFHEGLDWISDLVEDIWQVQLLNCNTPVYPGDIWRYPVLCHSDPCARMDHP